MTLPNIRVHRRAIAEGRAAYRWYARRSTFAAQRFLLELDKALQAISASPDRWPTHLFGTRVYQLRRFPYLVIYLIDANTPTVVAVMHGRRRPGYWRKRLP
jgi:plasmid stabilization system protein ParE